MDRYRRDMSLLTGGALLGVAVVLVLAPRTRQTVWRAIDGWIREAMGSSDPDRDGIEQEAAATEGGLAGTRGWQKAIVPGG